MVARRRFGGGGGSERMRTSTHACGDARVIGVWGIYKKRLLKFRDFGPPPLPCQYQIHATSFPLVRD